MPAEYNPTLYTKIGQTQLQPLTLMVILFPD